MDKEVSDETISMAMIKSIHKQVAKSGSKELLRRLAEREPSLAAYLFVCAAQMADRVEKSGAPVRLVNSVQEGVLIRLLVTSEVQRLALHELWRELLPTNDLKTRPPQSEHTGDNHE